SKKKLLWTTEVQDNEKLYKPDTRRNERRNTRPDPRNIPRTRECYCYGREGHYSREYPENISPVSVTSTAVNPIPNVHYCEWQLEEENSIDAYVAGGTMLAKRERPKCKPESSSGESSHVSKIRRAVDPVEPMEMSTQSMEKEVPAKKIRRKREPSVIDSLDPYDIADNILALPATATIEQMLQYPN
ncbi:9895_t:CDS:2, partial [Acaulospora morrowiae]